MDPVNTADEMACEELVEVLTDYLEATLPDADRRRLEAHIAGCDPCREYIEQMRATLRAVGRLGAAELDADARSRLLDAFRTWRQATPG